MCWPMNRDGAVDLLCTLGLKVHTPTRATNQDTAGVHTHDTPNLNWVITSKWLVQVLKARGHHNLLERAMWTTIGIPPLVC